MKTVTDVINEYSEFDTEVQITYRKIYKERFAVYLDPLVELHTRMESEAHRITDSELEYILTDLPLNLFMVAEQLNELRLRSEVIRLENKRKREELQSKFKTELDASDVEYSKTYKEAQVKSLVLQEMVSYDVLLSIYETLISRVENELTYAKELIMGAKKVWDSRRSSEQSNPIGEVVKDASTLPEYPRVPNYYIK